VGKFGVECGGEREGEKEIEKGAGEKDNNVEAKERDMLIAPISIAGVVLSHPAESIPHRLPGRMRNTSLVSIATGSVHHGGGVFWKSRHA